MPTMRLSIRGFLLSLLLLSTSATAGGELRVYAAASLTTAMTDIAAAYEQAGHPAVKTVFAASSTLAKQIEAGAPSDIFMSADLKWMDYLDTRGKLVAGTRRPLLGNTLVVIAPADKGFPLSFEKGFDFAGAFRGRLCTGEPGIVPVGIYAQESLENLGWWKALQGRIVGTDDVRTALAFVERGECPAGIVYGTDAAISKKVEVVGTFPEYTHKPIVYPIALVRGASKDATELLQYIQTSPEATAIFQRYGFKLLAAP